MGTVVPQLVPTQKCNSIAFSNKPPKPIIDKITITPDTEKDDGHPTRMQFAK